METLGSIANEDRVVLIFLYCCDRTGYSTVDADQFLDALDFAGSLSEVQRLSATSSTCYYITYRIELHIILLPLQVDDRRSVP